LSLDINGGIRRLSSVKILNRDFNDIHLWPLLSASFRFISTSGQTRQLFAFSGFAGTSSSSTNIFDTKERYP
jgi:hypothetical protein